MKRLSWKYIAGFVDGEGCLDMQLVKDPRTKNVGSRNGLYTYVRPRLRIAQAKSSKFVLEMCKENFGGNMFLRTRSANPNWQDAYCWTTEGKRLRPFLQNITKHLIIKKEQAKFCIWIIDNVLGKHVKNEVRELLRDEMKAMKRDPQRLSESAVRKVKELMR